jgi:ribosome-interacting GTPase 1
MPMPHRTQMQVIKRRLIGKEGSECVRELRAILDDASLEALKEAIWRLTGLLRVYLRYQGKTDEEPLALEPGATVADVAREIHKSLAGRFRGARLWGPSARFAGQVVGREHQVQDGDTVEII